MVSFYETYSSAEFAEQIAALPFVKSIVSSETTQLQIPDNQNNVIVSFEMTQLEPNVSFPRILLSVNWTSHVEIMASCRTFPERIFYMLYANKERLNVKELGNAIAKDAYSIVLSSPRSQSVGFKQIYPNNGYDFKDRAILDF